VGEKCLPNEYYTSVEYKGKRFGLQKAAKPRLEKRIYGVYGPLQRGHNNYKYKKESKSLDGFCGHVEANRYMLLLLDPLSQQRHPHKALRTRLRGKC
jgi:hypothetical protein